MAGVRSWINNGFKAALKDSPEVTLKVPDPSGKNSTISITEKIMDIDRFKQPMTQMMDYDTYKSINTDSTVTPEEFAQLKAQV